MKIVRAVLAAALLALFVALPMLRADGIPTGGVELASAAPAADSRHPEKEEKNRNENWNENGNSNGNNNDNDDNDRDNGDDKPARNNRRLLPNVPPAPPAAMTDRCFNAGQSGSLTLVLTGGTVTLNVVANSAFPRASRVTLAKVDPASVPATPGARLDDIVFEIRAQDGCDGSALSELPADANLGVSYTVSADKPTLRFALLNGQSWTDVPTVADSSNPYVSATVRRAGTYTLYQSK